MPIALRARTVYPVDGPAIDGGTVSIEGERIVAIGLRSTACGPIEDLGDAALVPGFINAHTHLEFSHLRKPLGRAGMPLIEWLPLAIAERSSHAVSVADSLTVGIQESLLAGTCAIGEIATADAAAYPTDGGPPIVSFLEVIGFSRARADSAFAALHERLTSARKSRQHVGLSPHAPYTVSLSLLAKLVSLAREQSLPVAMHLAESTTELELIAEGSGPFRELLEARSMWDPEAIPRGSRPLDYLRMLAEAPRALVIHGNYLAAEEHEFLAQTDQMTLVYCPRTHAFFDHPHYPLAELLQRGVRVALGTDSRASNPSLNMRDELRQVMRTHEGVSAPDMLAMATIHGATALGLEDVCGSITPGKLANLVAIPDAGRPLGELLAADSEPAGVWFRGRRV